MRLFEWKNLKTGEIIETDQYDTPPVLPGDWQRVYSLSFGRIEGAGGSKGGYVQAK